MLIIFKLILKLLAVSSSSKLMYRSIIQKMDSGPKESENIASTAVPISSTLLDDIWPLLGYADRSKLMLALVNNVVSISDNTYFKLLDGTYDSKLRQSLLELYLPKVNNLSLNTLTWLVKHDESSVMKDTDERLLANIHKYKELLLSLSDFDTKKFVASQFSQKTKRNKVLAIFGLPQEPLINKGDGIELFGTFYPMSYFKTSTHYKSSQAGVVFILEHKNGDIHSDDVYVTITRDNAAGFMHSGFTFTLSGVWILTDQGNLIRE